MRSFAMLVTDEDCIANPTSSGSRHLSRIRPEVRRLVRMDAAPEESCISAVGEIGQVATGNNRASENQTYTRHAGHWLNQRGTMPEVLSE